VSKRADQKPRPMGIQWLLPRSTLSSHYRYSRLAQLARLTGLLAYLTLSFNGLSMITSLMFTFFLKNAVDQFDAVTQKLVVVYYEKLRLFSLMMNN